MRRGPLGLAASGPRAATPDAAGIKCHYPEATQILPGGRGGCGVLAQAGAPEQVPTCEGRAGAGRSEDSLEQLELSFSPADGSPLK